MIARHALRLGTLSLALLNCSSPVSPHDASAARDAADTVIPDTSVSDVPNSEGGLPGDVLSIVVTPPTQTLQVNDGLPLPTVQFHAMAVRRDGTMQPAANAVWSVPAGSLIGAIAADGTFTASGIAAGSVTVDAAVPGTGGANLHATATVTVQIFRSVLATGTTAAAQATYMDGVSMGAPGSAGSATLVYPIDRAFMPHNVAAPDVQWDGGNAGDVYRITLSKPDLTLQGFVLHSGAAFNFDWQPDLATWRTVVESDVDAPLQITIDRCDSAAHVVHPGTPLQVRIGRDSTFGNVYYWATNEGRLRRIDATTSTLDTTFLQTPPNNCVACHTISRDGRYLIGATPTAAGGYSYIAFDLTQDLTVASPPTLPPVMRDRLSGTFNADGTRALIFGQGQGSAGMPLPSANGFVLINPQTGMEVPSTGLPTDLLIGHADWSPDGAHVVYSTNFMGALNGYNDHWTASDLAIMSVTGDDDHLVFGAPTVVHHGPDLSAATETGGADARASFSPDSHLIAFQHSVEASSQFDGHGAIYAIAPTGGTPVRLDNAMGGPTGTSGFWPSFSPFVSHETTDAMPARYYWLAFYSQRDYGNTRAGTRGTSNRQLWITAVRADGAAAADPSSVPYWLPGQDRGSQNAAARWAPAACRPNGETCTTGATCCSAICDTTNHCAPPPPAQCRQAGQLCGGSSDCCNGLVCFGNVCGATPG